MFTIVQASNDGDSITFTNHHGSSRKVLNSVHGQGLMMEAKKEKNIGQIVKIIVNKIFPSFVVIFSLSYISFAIYCFLII